MNKVEKRYADWDKATKRMSKIQNKKAYRKDLVKTIFKWLIYIVIALLLIVPIIIGCMISSEIVAGVGGAFAQLGEDHRRLRENKRYY